MRRLLLLAVLLVLLTGGCRRQTQQVVGVVPKGANHIFWQTVHAGAIKAAREFGFEVEWNAPTLEVDSSRQIEIVESMVNRRLAGIVLAPVDKKALVNIVERAAREGIPVSIFVTVAVLAQTLHLIDPDIFGDALFMLFSGGLALGAVYMATDMVTSPVTNVGCWIFGIGIGALVVLIRTWGGLAEGVMYSILLMNAMVPFINRATQPRLFGTGRRVATP